jgi:hypothetical protein
VASWRTENGFLLHGKCIFVLAKRDLHQQVLTLTHTAGHEGIQKTLQRLRANFYITGDRALVQDYVRACARASATRCRPCSQPDFFNPSTYPPRCG